MIKSIAVMFSRKHLVWLLSWTIITINPRSHSNTIQYHQTWLVESFHWHGCNHILNKVSAVLRYFFLLKSPPILVVSQNLKYIQDKVYESITPKLNRK